MKLYVQLMILFVISLIGEGISSFFHLPIPGSIIGLIILFIALQFKWLRTRHVNMVGNFLLANMTILFLPPAVGIMEKFDVIAPYLLPIVLIASFQKKLLYFIINPLYHFFILFTTISYVRETALIYTLTYYIIYLFCLQL